MAHYNYVQKSDTLSMRDVLPELAESTVQLERKLVLSVVLCGMFEVHYQQPS